MSNRFFFGYGSLVNRATHAHDPAYAATLEGWCRVWRHLPGRAHATLSVMPEPGTQIAGLIASVKADDWAALDAREAAYTRHEVSGAGVHSGPEAAEIAMYVVPFGADAPAPAPIQLSYLDVVVQGYDAVFGAEGVADFFATTRGWEAPVLDDRAAPLYPRHQALARQQLALVDAMIAQHGLRLIPG